MKIVVTDSNVFSLFFECDLLIKLMSSNTIEIYIPEKIYKEITDTAHRIPREYPGIPPLIQQARYGHGNSLGTRIFVKDVRTFVTNPNAVNAYAALEKQKDINPGEREAIPLAIELQADFISNDSPAVKELNTTYSGLGSIGKNIDLFIDDLEVIQTLTKPECTILRKALWG